MRKLIFADKVVYIDSENQKEKIGCIYLYFFGTVFTFDTRFGLPTKEKRLKKYSLSQLEKIARKNKCSFSFAVSASGGDQVAVSIQKKKGFSPIIDIVITDGSSGVKGRMSKEERMTSKALKDHFVKKNFLISSPFKKFLLFARKEDLSTFEENPEVHLFSRTDNDEVFIEIWGKLKDVEKMIKQLRKCFSEKEGK